MITAPSGGVLNFGNVLVGTTASGNVSAKYSGSGTTTLTFKAPVASPAVFGQTGTTVFTNVPSGTPGTRTATYTFSPTSRGSYTGAATVTASNGNSASATLQGRGVAPVNSVTSSDAGLTRLGTSGAASITVNNLGNGNTTAAGAAVGNLTGTVQAPTGSASFSNPGSTAINLPDSGSKTVSYTYTPTDRSGDTATVVTSFTNGDSQGHNAAQAVTTTLSGQGVGPDYQSTSAPGSTLDFGSLAVGSTSFLGLGITNASTDPNGGLTTLTDLTLLSAIISGADVSAFSLLGFSPGAVLHEGDQLGLLIAFNSDLPGAIKTATLTITTDQGTAFGSSGQTFTYTLQGESFLPIVPLAVAPEPSTALAAGTAALLGLACLRRRRRVAA